MDGSLQIVRIVSKCALVTLGTLALGPESTRFRTNKGAVDALMVLGTSLEVLAVAAVATIALIRDALRLHALLLGLGVCAEGLGIIAISAVSTVSLVSLGLSLGLSMVLGPALPIGGIWGRCGRRNGTGLVQRS